jgi:uncharacterized membrane protein YidH (DUF202 family)
LADTGAASRTLVAWAIVLIVAGIGLAAGGRAGRRRGIR